MSEFKKTVRKGIEYYYVSIKIGEKNICMGETRPVVKTLYSRTKKGLERKLSEFNEKQSLEIVPSESYFNILSDEWIENYFIPDTTIKDSTKSTYIRAWKKRIRDAEFYYDRVSNITAKRIQKYYVDLVHAGVRSSEISKLNKLLSRFYAYLEMENLSRNIIKNVKIPKDLERKEKKQITLWTDEELSLILDGLDTVDYRFRLRFFIILAVFTGARFGELLALKYDDFTDDGLLIRRQLQEEYVYNKEGKDQYKPKIESLKTTHSERIIPLHKQVLEEAIKHVDWQKKDAKANGYNPHGYVFTTSNGTFYIKRNVRRALARYYKSIGVKNKSVHTYRHTFATNLCKNSSIEIASSILGHADISTTAKYYVGVSMKQKQAAIDALIEDII